MGYNYVKIGSILKPIGVGGDLKIDLDERFEKDFFKSKHFFILLNGDYVPYFVEYVKEINNLIVKFEDINSPEQGTKLSQKEVFLRESDVISTTYKNQKEKSQWIGYTVYNGQTMLAKIDDILLYPQQIMAQIMYNNITKLIPLVDEWITDIDQRKKIIWMSLPEGLLEV